MKLYEVRRYSSESEKRAVEYVKQYTKEAYTKTYRYTPEVLKLDDGRTKYTLCIKAKQVATACKYLTAYFAAEIQSLSAIVADILANDPKTSPHTEYTVHGDGYTCYVYVGDDAGNIHIVLYLDAEASEESNAGETETETEGNEEEKGATKIAERYQSKSGDTYSIITEREDGRYFVAIDCGEKGDKCGQSKIFDTYEEAYRYLRSVGCSALMKVIEVDESVGENEKKEEMKMNDTVKEIIKSLEDRLNNVAYVQEHTKDWIEKRNALAEGHALYMAYDEACKIAGVRYECGRSIRGGKECDTYTAVYPTETKAETADETTAKTVVEPCPHCESEIGMEWDVKTQGYKATCPVCGKRLMLCDACQHRGEDGELLDDCDYDSKTDTCKFNLEGRR